MDMQRSLVAFLNHGVLPFVGRVPELDRIRSFWNETAEAPGLRVLLLVGEAGIGKSRLIEESTRGIAASGGAVVHVKLYPDASTSLAPLLARALSRCGAAQQLLKSEPEETISSVFSALTRICGLRPTLFVVEDLHLLNGDALAEFAALLERLSDEPLSLLASARPANIPARSVLERYLVDEIELAGLPATAVDHLCTSVFGDRIDPKIIRVLCEKTMGNAMALRSALRAGLKSGSVAAGARTRSMSVRIDQATFVEELGRNVRLLSEGMAAHLNDREKLAARMLAPLGEVFARETAASILENAEGMLEILIFKGILHNSSSAPAPLPGDASASAPLAFTHTLLHRHFIDHRTIDTLPIIQVLASEHPLYSLLPFSLIVEHGAPTSATVDELEAAIIRTLHATKALDSGPDWGHAMKVWEAASILADALDPTIGDTRRNRLEAQLLLRKLSLMRREQTSEYPLLLDRLLDLTADPPDQEWAELQMRALVYRRRHLRVQNLRRSLEVWEDVERLTDRFPLIRFSDPYVSHLRESIRIALAEGDVAHQRKIEALMQEIFSAPEADEDVKRYAWSMISPYLLTLFESHEELEQRLALLADLEASAEKVEPELMMWKIGIYYAIGWLREAIETINGSLELFAERGLIQETMSCRMIVLLGRLLLGTDPKELEEEILEVPRSAPARMRPTLEAIISSNFASAGLLLNDLEWTRHILTLLPNVPASFTPATAILLAINGNNPKAMPTDVQGHELPDRVLHGLLMLYRGDQSERAQALELAMQFLLQRTLKLDEVLVKCATIDLLAQLWTGAEEERLRPTCRTAVREMVEWLAAPIPLVGLRMIEKYQDCFTRSEARAWKSRLEPAMIEPQTEASVDRRTRISLLGTITVQRPGEEPERVRGTQLCALLGLMSANRLLREPLSGSEFTAIVMGTERDPESARKSMNFAVFRLREILGSDAISTDGETPALSSDLVQVDLVLAHQHLRAASDAMRDGALLRAVPELMAALEISRGEVPFPTLYDEFFEAAREDFETELRATTLRVARALAREEDHNAAERILGRAFAAMPDDEELAELLQGSLVALGKRTEATRVGMKAAEMMM